MGLCSSNKYYVIEYSNTAKLFEFCDLSKTIFNAIILILRKRRLFASGLTNQQVLFLLKHKLTVFQDKCSTFRLSLVNENESQGTSDFNPKYNFINAFDITNENFFINQCYILSCQNDIDPRMSFTIFTKLIIGNFSQNCVRLIPKIKNLASITKTLC